MRLLQHLSFATFLLCRALALPIEPRLINVSPQVNPKVDLSDSLSCIGVAVCNPVTVDKNASRSGSTQPQPAQQQSPPQQAGGNGGGGSLVNVAPVVSPDVDLSGLLSCVGIANCNPVTVNEGPGST